MRALSPTQRRSLGTVSKWRCKATYVDEDKVYVCEGTHVREDVKLVMVVTLTEHQTPGSLKLIPVSNEPINYFDGAFPCWMID